jgi:transcriptional regulator with XRE-family HTH domain
MTIYIRVREIAESQNLTVLEVAQKAGLAPSTVRRLWRDPHAQTDTRVLDKLAKALAVDASELIRS